MKFTSLVFMVLGLAATSAFAEDIGSIESTDPAGSSVSVKDAQGATVQRAVGAPIAQAEHVLAAAGQTVVLKLKDGSEVSAAPGADLSVENYIPSQAGSMPHVVIQQGSAHFDINKTSTGHPTFFVHTSSATMGVRGTEFIVDQQSDGYSVVHTLDGKVAMAKSEGDLENTSKSVDVAAGHTSYLHPSMSAPAASKIFNRKTYLTQLSKNYPGLTKQVEHSHQRQLQRKAAENERAKQLKQSSEEKKQIPPKRRPVKKKQ